MTGVHNARPSPRGVVRLHHPRFPSFQLLGPRGRDDVVKFFLQCLPVCKEAVSSESKIASLYLDLALAAPPQLFTRTFP